MYFDVSVNFAAKKRHGVTPAKLVHMENLLENAIGHLPNVREISFTEGCNDDALRWIAKYCPKLETLDVSFSNSFSDAGLKNFCEVKTPRNRTAGRFSCMASLISDLDLEIPFKEIYVSYTDVQAGGIKFLLESFALLEKIGYEPGLPEVLHTIHETNKICCFRKGKKYNLTHLTIEFRDTPTIRDGVLESCATLCPNLRSVKCKVLAVGFFQLLYELPGVES